MSKEDAAEIAASAGKLGSEEKVGTRISTAERTKATQAKTRATLENFERRIRTPHNLIEIEYKRKEKAQREERAEKIYSRPANRVDLNGTFFTPKKKLP